MNGLSPISIQEYKYCLSCADVKYFHGSVYQSVPGICDVSGTKGSLYTPAQRLLLNFFLFDLQAVIYRNL